MYQNVSSKPQAIKDYTGMYKPVAPSEIVSELVYNDVSGLKDIFKKLKKIDFSSSERILFRRGHALGDVIMTFPIVNYLRKMGKTVFVHTNTKYAIKGVDFILGRPKIYPEDFDLVIDLNLILERDHYESRYFKVNRVDMYKEFLGLKNIGNDWNIDFPELNIDVEDAVVGIQYTGSQSFKSIQITPVLDELERRGIRFYVIDDSKYDLSYKNAVRRPTDVVGLLNIFKKLKGVICYDSGPLWISHVTNTPAFVIAGPTSGKKITCRHPNKKTTYYDTRKHYRCNLKHGCGESAIKCNKMYSCMKHINYIELNKKLFNWLGD
jgi:hypothetical protein